MTHVKTALIANDVPWYVGDVVDYIYGGDRLNQITSMSDLADVLEGCPDLTALLDVQNPEPPDAGSRLYRQSNVYMTSHIAGSTNDEVRRMADYMLDDFRRWLNGEPLLYAVNTEELKGRA